jgi:siderophore synthetase component
MVLEIDSLSKLGRLESEFEVVKGLKIKLHTLSMEEQHRALTSVPATLTDATGQFHHLQRALLVEATELVNDVKATKEELVKLYSEIQENVFQQIAVRYTDLLQQQNNVTDALKKDFK